MTAYLIKDLPRFKVEDLHGRTLKISVGQSNEDGYETKVIMGLDETTGIIYVISSTQTYKGETNERD